MALFKSLWKISLGYLPQSPIELCCWPVLSVEGTIAMLIESGGCEDSNGNTCLSKIAFSVFMHMHWTCIVKCLMRHQPVVFQQVLTVGVQRWAIDECITYKLFRVHFGHWITKIAILAERFEQFLHECLQGFCFLVASLLSFEQVVTIHCLAALDLASDIKQPIDCLVIQSCQAMHSMGRSMDWTLEENKVVLLRHTHRLQK